MIQIWFLSILNSLQWCTILSFLHFLTSVLCPETTVEGKNNPNSPSWISWGNKSTFILPFITGWTPSVISTESRFDWQSQECISCLMAALAGSSCPAGQSSGQSCFAASHFWKWRRQSCSVPSSIFVVYYTGRLLSSQTVHFGWRENVTILGETSLNFRLIPNSHHI